MADKPVFTILCALQMVIGFLTFIFGLIDRIGIQMMISFLMLPIWTGVLIGLAGFSGLIIGRENKRQGYATSGMSSGLKALNTVCFGLSLLMFNQYGVVLSFIGYRIELTDDYENQSIYSPTKIYPPAKQASGLGGTNDDDTRQGIFAMIMILSLVEMLLGAWLVMLDKEKMVLGSPMNQDQVPLIVAEPAQHLQQAQPVQYAQTSTGMVVATPQVQQQQQPVYMVAQGNTNAPLPARAVVAPNQPIPQQPSYVVLQPSGVVPSNQPQVMRPQPQYVVMQNPNPSPAAPQVVVQGEPATLPQSSQQTTARPSARAQQAGHYDVRTSDSPAPESPGDVHSYGGGQ